MNKGYTLRKRLEDSPILLAPGVYDALSALLVERTGFEAAYVSGASISYTSLGLPDLGFVGLDDVSRVVERISNVVALPLIVDADTGYGNDINVRRTVKVLETAGADAIQLEDQVFPKKCGHLEGKEVIEEKEMVAKIKAAVESRREALIVARTDALAVVGVKEAIRRANLYLEAGADVAFVESPRTEEELAEVGRLVKGLKMANMVEGGRTPLLSAKKLEELGFHLVIFPGAAVRTIVRALTEMLTTLKADGTTERYLHRMIIFQELQKILGGV